MPHPLALLGLLAVALAQGPDLPAPYARPALGGGEIDLGALRGRPVLVSLWATWCPPCLQELPAIAALHAGWAPRGLQVVALAIDDPPARVAVRARELGITWPVAFDAAATASPAFGTDELPTTILYDAQGHRVWSHEGPLAAEDPALLAALAALLPVAPAGDQYSK